MKVMLKHFRVGRFCRRFCRPAVVLRFRSIRKQVSARMSELKSWPALLRGRNR